MLATTVYDGIENDTASNEEIENKDEDNWVFDEGSGYWIAKDKSGFHSFRIVCNSLMTSNKIILFCTLISFTRINEQTL